MNSSSRFIAGFVASLLLTVGLLRAAERLHEIAEGRPASSPTLQIAAVNCTQPCQLVDRTDWNAQV